ncbi:hypothetical protein BBJ28_00000263 [Nothophytophthora sp. Chile5]|nr:hypothetical protein BBJ28_00000263 [Nothophytophthora sp. Chile5]
MAANSLPELRGFAPDPWTYSPAARGQFPHAYTIQEIQAERKRSALRSRTIQHPVSEQGEAVKLLHLALGPGSYEVDRDQNQEVIATPFTFTREKRHGILENTSALGREGCSPGPGVYRIESSTAVGSTSTLARSYAPVRSCPRVDAGGRRQKKDENDKEQDGDYHFSCREVGRLSASSGSQKQQRSSFGGVASRDLLTSMVAAGHTSAHTIGPGVYDAHRSSVVMPTHNVSYKLELQRPEEQQPRKPKLKTKLNSKNQVDIKVEGAVADKVDVTSSKLSQREMWKVMRRGPALPSGQV